MSLTASAADSPLLRACLAAGFAFLLALTTGLVVLGALVRAHDAGLACPDWPLCFGELVPRMNLRVAFEWTHRLVAGCVASLFAGLALLTLYVGGRRGALPRLLAVSAGLLAVQIVLGALTVWLKLASWTVTAHLLTGNAFAATLLLIAAELRTPMASARTRAPTRARCGVAVAGFLLVVQMVLGGIVSSSYAGMACPEWPTCNGGVWFPTFRGPVGVHLLHRLNGYALLVALGAAAIACRHSRGLRAAAIGALALGVAQVLVGIANVLLGIPVEVTGIHSALAAALVLALTLAIRLAWWAPAAVDPG